MNPVRDPARRNKNAKAVAAVGSTQARPSTRTAYVDPKQAIAKKAKRGRPRKETTVSRDDEHALRLRREDRLQAQFERKGERRVLLTPEQVESEFGRYDVEDCPDSFFSLVVAPRRNGKSEMVQSLLHDFYQNKEKRFDYVFLFSQTGAGYEDQIPPTYRFYDLAHLPAICNEQQRIKQYNKKCTRADDRIKCRVLILLDDMIGEAVGPDSLKNSSMIRKLAVNGRHLGNDGVPGNGISVMILTQSLTAVPRIIRLQTDMLFCGKVASRKEREMLAYEYLCLQSDRDGIGDAYHTMDSICYSAPFRFLVISCHKQDRREHKDYVTYYNAPWPNVKQKHLFGDKVDWMEEINHKSIFDEGE